MDKTLLISLLLLAQALSQSPWQPVGDAIANSSQTDLSITVGNASGQLYTYVKGNMPPTRLIPIASASKWLAGTIIMAIVERGQLLLDSPVHSYLPFWTSDVGDKRSLVTLRSLLSFTSGFAGDSDCVGNSSFTPRECTLAIYNNEFLNVTPGRVYYYGGNHLHIAADIATTVTGKAWSTLVTENLRTPLGITLQELLFSPPSNPNVAGGVVTNTDTYIKFLSSVLSRTLFNNRTTYDVMETDHTPQPPTTIAFTPVRSNNGDWHYALSHWIWCNQQNFSAPPGCANLRIYSSPGAFGYTPWVDRVNQYWAVIAVQTSPGSGGVISALAQQIQPLIVNALNSGAPSSAASSALASSSNGGVASSALTQNSVSSTPQEPSSSAVLLSVQFALLLSLVLLF